MTSAFAIEVIEDPPDDERELFGRIRLNDFVERFLMDVEFLVAGRLSRELAGRLRAAGRGARRHRVLPRGLDVRPDDGQLHLDLAALPGRQTVFVQNHIVFIDELETPLDLTRPWLAIKPRRTHDEEGQRISEWSVPLATVRRFLET